MSAVPLVLQFSPVALEMLDHTVFSTAVDVNRPRFMDDDSGDGGSLLIVEFAGDSLSDVEQKLNTCKDKLSAVSTTLESASDENSCRQIWEARKSALNNAMKFTVGSRKPLGLIEDTVVNHYGGFGPVFRNKLPMYLRTWREGKNKSHLSSNFQHHHYSKQSTLSDFMKKISLAIIVSLSSIV
jgi:hypothetical protein